uniref:Uncharacterized protein n=1 Tax=Hanusia phi TaxID=3032 RepID=A0A7S0E1Q3_9CRYP|mmetsp:Transcript_14088/g.32486  ORF Transcript_14088/g.32486 Transcript_14088/m.32486 type:complete len:201 (+) Transcript_14088:59-661(+)
MGNNSSRGSLLSPRQRRRTCSLCSSDLHTSRTCEMCGGRKLGMAPPNTPFSLSLRADLFASEVEEELRRRLVWEAGIYSAIIDLKQKPPELVPLLDVYSRYIIGDLERQVLCRKVEDLLMQLERCLGMDETSVGSDCDVRRRLEWEKQIESRMDNLRKEQIAEASHAREWTKMLEELEEEKLVLCRNIEELLDMVEVRML